MWTYNGQTKTAPAKFEDDLAPTANHSGGKDLMKLRGCVAFCPFVARPEIAPRLLPLEL